LQSTVEGLVHDAGAVGDDAILVDDAGHAQPDPPS
jgi:hypothetical protein